MSNTLIEKWQAAARALPEEATGSLNMPLHVAFAEGEQVAYFTESYWKAAEDGLRPGLSSVSSELAADVAQEIRELIAAARTVHMRVLFPAGTPDTFKKAVERLTFIVRELNAALTFLLEDGVAEPADEALAGAKERLSEDSTLATLLQGAIDLIGIASEQRARLARLSAIFEMPLLEEGGALVDEITTAGSQPQGVKASPDVELRDRLYALAEQRIRKVRAAARFVYRAQPEIARQVASAYRRESRARAAKAKAVRPETPTPTV